MKRILMAIVLTAMMLLSLVPVAQASNGNAYGKNAGTACAEGENLEAKNRGQCVSAGVAAQKAPGE